MSLVSLFKLTYRSQNRIQVPVIENIFVTKNSNIYIYTGPVPSSESFQNITQNLSI